MYCMAWSCVGWTMAYRVTQWAGAPEGAIAKAAELAKQDGWHNPDQYKNKANPASHFKTTGPEIWKQAWLSLPHSPACRVHCKTLSAPREGPHEMVGAL